jgi:hypothetical protein
MTARLVPFETLAQKYGGILGWHGDLLVHTLHALHGKKTYRVTADDTLELSDVGVLISWPGVEPTGVFLPAGEIVAIEQVSPGTDDPE